MKNKYFILFLCILFLVIILLIFVSQINKQGPIVLPKEFHKGVSLSPISFSQEDFLDFFTKAKEAGKIITWAGEWQELKNKNSAPYVVQKLSRQYNYEPIIITSMPEQYDEDYKNTIISFIQESEIKYIGIGNEINLDYQNSYSETFSKIYDDIKQISPNTQVFTIFQLEEMKKENQWNLIFDFGKSDLIAFTTYPIILYQSPSEIPNNYYSEIQQYTTKQIAFTEIGWPRKNNEQIEFLKQFSILSSSINPGLIIWPFLYDQNVQEPFNTMGLLQKGQETSDALDEWKKI